MFRYALCLALMSFVGVAHADVKKCPPGKKCIEKNKCPHGTHYKKDCNTCTCDPKTGMTRCTLMKCLK